MANVTFTAAELATIAAQAPKGATGIQGPKGVQGIPGVNGLNGKDGVSPVVDLAALAVQVAAILNANPVPPPVVVPPPVITPPAPAGTLWVFHSGQYNSPGEYDFGSGQVIDNVDDPAVPGLKVLRVLGDEGLQIRMLADDFPSAGYAAITFRVKPKLAGTVITTGAEEKGDITIPGTNGMFNIAPYAVGVIDAQGYQTYVIPLSAYGIVNGLHVYKFAWLGQNPAGNTGNEIDYTDIGFIPLAA